MNDNETGAEVLAEFGKNIELMRKCKCVGVSLWNCLKFKLRIEAAHKREIADFQLRYDECVRKFNEADLERVRLREEIASLKMSIERWMQYHETAKGERDACLDELKMKDAEIAAYHGERKGLLKANESLAADNTRLRGEIAAKDSEIASLKSKIYEYERQPELMADVATK